MLWRLKFRSLANRRLQQEIDDEIASHVELAAEELQAKGLSPQDALEEAQRRFGNRTQAAEKTRDLHVLTLLETVDHDIRYGLRRLLREPLFSIAAVLTLGLVIGANGAIFSVLEAVLLRPLPFDTPSRLVLMFGSNKQDQRSAISIPDLEDWRKARSFSSIGALQTQSVSLTGRGEPVRLVGGFGSSDLFRALAMRTSPGRGIIPTDDKEGAARICILSRGLWRDRFGSDPTILGKALILNGEPHTVAGIVALEYKSQVTNADVWLPIQSYTEYSRDRSRGVAIAVGRLADDVSIRQAQAELDTITRALASHFPATNRDRGALLFPLHEYLVSGSRQILFILAGAVICVLLIGYANLAGLLLTKAVARQQEMAIRSSLAEVRRAP